MAEASDPLLPPSLIVPEPAIDLSLKVNFILHDDPRLWALFEALSMAQGAFDPIHKNRKATIRPRDSTKQAYTFEYADMDAIRAATQPSLSANGLSTFAFPVMLAEGRHLRSVLAHKSGASMYAELPIPAAGDGQITEVIKAYGGLMTYLRRYLKIALLDLSADNDADDDGTEASNARGSFDITVHLGMKAAKTVGELSKIMSGFDKADKAKYAEYFNVRTTELKEAQA